MKTTLKSYGAAVSIYRIATIIIFGCIFHLPLNAIATDISQTIQLERDTVLPDGNIEIDEGYLLNNGKYEVLTSLEEGLLGVPLETYEAISGKPIMYEEEFNDLKAARIIPHWVRSRETFDIGLLPSVIVSVAGGPDPNPTITIQTQPQNQNVIDGDSAFFYVEATPAAYLSYQWLFNGKPIAGQTDSGLFITIQKPSQAGNYSVALDTGGKKVVSKKAALKIVLPVQITSNPKSQTIKEGRGAVFRVAAKGTGPFTYQWYFNGNVISGATRSFYTISKVSQTDVGTYTVVVSNSLTFDTSTDAALAVD